MNWIKVFNKEKIGCEDILYGKCCEIYDTLKVECDDYMVKIMNSFEPSDVLLVEFDEFVEDFNLNHRKCQEMLLSRLDSLGDGFIALYKEMKTELINKVIKHIKNEKEFNMMIKRFSIWERNVFLQPSYFIAETLNDLFSNIEIYGDFLIENIDDIIKKEESESDKLLDFFESIEDNNKVEVKKIFCFKEMGKLAEKEGYEYKWSNGSHRIYEHKNSNKIIVIPSHELGLGLSREIQKQIYKNAC